jgi:hypothetical protein
MTLLTMLALCLAPLAQQDLDDGRAGVRVVVSPPVPNQVEVHDVRALTGFDRLAQLEASLTNSSGLGDPRALEAQVEELARRRVEAAGDAEALTSALRTYMEPGFDGKHDQVLDLGQGSLMVVASAQKQAWVREFLRRQGAHTSYIVLEAQLLTAPAGTFAKIGIERSGMLLDDARMQQMLLDAQSASASLVTSPKLVTRPLEQAELMAIEELAYVRDWKLEVVQPGDVTIADPQVDVLREGIVMRARTVPLGAGLYGVDFEMSVSRVERPIPTRTFTLLPNSTPVTVSEPVLHEVELGSTLRIAPGTSAAFVAHDTEEGREVLVTLRLDVLDAASLPALAPEQRDPARDAAASLPVRRR